MNVSHSDLSLNWEIATFPLKKFPLKGYLHKEAVKVGVVKCVQPRPKKVEFRTRKLGVLAVSKVHVFIDTNVFLNFFAYTNDDIEELKKLVGLIEKKKIILYLTDQICREFARNREGKIQEALKEFRKLHIPGLPRLMAHYEGAKTYGESTKEIKKFHNTIIERVKQDALSERLPADELFADLMRASAPIVPDKSDLKAARERVERNDPPGKPGSMGDQLNWELLLAYVPEKTSLHIVSKDGDYSSSIDSAKPHPVLAKEWESQNEGSLHLHTELGAFFATRFPSIKVATDIEKRDAIDRLIGSTSFERTHAAISKLQEFTDLLTAAEVKELVEAALDNSQIRWIGTDPDVKRFFEKIVSPHLAGYSEELQSDVRRTFRLPKAKSSDDGD